MKNVYSPTCNYTLLQIKFAFSLLHYTLIIFILFLTAFKAVAQIDSFGFSTTTFVDNQIDNQPQITRQRIYFNEQNPPLKSTLTGWDGALNYQFNGSDSRLGTKATTDINAIGPEVIYNNPTITGQPFWSHAALDFKFQYQSISASANNQSLTDGNGYVVQASPGINLITGDDALNDQVAVLANFGFTYVGSTMSAAGPTIDTTSRAYAVGPAIAWTHKLNDRISLAVSPALAIQWKNSLTPTIPMNTESTLFSLPVRGDYALIANQLIASIQLTYYQDVSRNGFTGSMSDLLSYGQFGGGIRWLITPNLTAGVTYQYTAFNEQMSANTVSARIDYRF